MSILDAAGDGRIKNHIDLTLQKIRNASAGLNAELLNVEPLRDLVKDYNFPAHEGFDDIKDLLEGTEPINGAGGKGDDDIETLQKKQARITEKLEAELADSDCRCEKVISALKDEMADLDAKLLKVQKAHNNTPALIAKVERALGGWEAFWEDRSSFTKKVSDFMDFIDFSSNLQLDA